MTPQKTPLSARLNLFWANMLAPINAYLGTALIVLALAMALVGLVAQLIRIEGHLAALRYAMEDSSAATQPMPKEAKTKAKAKAKSPKAKQAKRRG